MTIIFVFTETEWPIGMTPVLVLASRLPGLPHSRRVDRVPPTSEHPADRQGVVPVPQADHGPPQALTGSVPLLQPQDHHLAVQVLGTPAGDVG